MTTPVEADTRLRNWLGRLRKNSVFHRVVLRDGFKCHWCGQMCDPTRRPTADLYPTEEHLIRHADGGYRTMDNIVVACRKCNNTRHHTACTTVNGLRT